MPVITKDDKGGKALPTILHKLEEELKAKAEEKINALLKDLEADLLNYSKQAITNLTPNEVMPKPQPKDITQEQLQKCKACQA